MTATGIAEILVYFLIIAAFAKPLGVYMAKVFEGERTWPDPLLKPVERVTLRIFGTRADEDMRWTTYAFAMLMFSVVGGLMTYLVMRLQGHLPWNPQHYSGVQDTPDLSFNTAMSFTTNTNWQNYTPESTISYFTNMVALAAHNWMSAAAGICIAVALVRGFARHSIDGIGNFWLDLVRCTLYVLLPICLVYSIFLIQQGVPQTFHPYITTRGLEGAAQRIPGGAVASQESIKMLGTNGGGIFNANSAHPYENPTPLTNFIQIVSIFLIPAGLCLMFGRMVKSMRNGWALFAAMSVLFLAGVFICYHFEAQGNPTVARLGVMTRHTSTQPGGNMEGKETRFGIASSALFATVTTDASCGAVNSMHDSYTPMGGFVPLFNVMCDEVIFGGVGAGLYGMLMYAVVAVFLAGLMVGRTPEYVGKKIKKYEVRMAMIAVLLLFANNAVWSSLSANLSLPPKNAPVIISPPTTTTMTTLPASEEPHLMASRAAWNHVSNSSPSQYDGPTWNNTNNNAAHGLTEILYAYCSATANNGSAFAGLTGNTPWYNITGGIAMYIGRFLMIIPLLAMAGSLARKKLVPVTAGTLATDTFTFVVLLAGIVVIVGALEYFPALALSPFVEHFQMWAGKTF